MTKPRLTFLVLITSLVGMLLAPQIHSHSILFYLLNIIGIWGLVAGSCTINCAIEKKVDAQMVRTQNRPIPAERITPFMAIIIGVFLIVLGSIILAINTNILTLVLGIIAALLYILAYTPLKIISPFAVYIGAIPGAIPPVMGLTSLTGTLDSMAFFLFMLLFIWQIPHFLSLSLFYQNDYDHAHIKIYPSIYGIKTTKFLINFFGLLLVIIGYFPMVINQGNILYNYVSIILGSILFLYALNGSRFKSITPELKNWARNYFYGTIIYLPMLLGFLILFKI